jgi:hypothetical protein
MDNEQRPSDKPRVLKSDTRKWSSGSVNLAVIGWEGRPDDNYIVCRKTLLGKDAPPQKFNLRQRDWINLKKLIEGDLQKYSEWERTVPTVDHEALANLIDEYPDVFEKVLSNPNILKLSDASFESLDRIAVKIYEVKAERIDRVFEELSAASGEDIERFAYLLEELRLNQVSALASMVHQKLKVIDVLERVCSDPQNSERDVHSIFEKNSWLLGKAYEIVQSDRPLSKYLQEHAPLDPEFRKRPDLILKTIPATQDVVLVELKAPGVPLKPEHIAQVLRYQGLIKNNKPNVGQIHCFVFGYEKDKSFWFSKDVEIKTFSELVAESRAEYREYLKIIETGTEVDSDEY